MDIAWEDVRIFLAIAETGSLSAAAKRLRVGQPTVSRRLAELEYRLGYKLFRRSAGGASLTSAGERLVEPSRKMAEWAGEVTRTASKAEQAPRGIVRLTAPPGVSFDFVAPFAAWMKEKHPLVRLEVLSTIQYLDLARGEADLALRTRAPTQADLTVVATLEHENAVFVSKEYKTKLPRRPSMADVDWIAWAPPYEDLPPNPQLLQLIPGFEPAFTTDNFLVMLRAAESGIGAMVLGKTQHRFSRDTLVPLDIDLGPYSRSSLHLVCAKSALDIPRVRVVAELLKKELERVRR
jgi:DNA-binding transcriptional LysR family regulator